MIRTPEMDKTCEYGVSSYWQNKDSDIKFDDKFEIHNSLKQIILGENIKSNTTSTFIENIKTDLTPDSTWVVTPKLKPVCVSASNPTAIDFAYAVHTNIGNNAVSAIVNGKKCSLREILKNGDVVEIVLSEEEKAPSRSWLSIVKTATARRRIREYFNKENTPANIEKGIRMLHEELLKTEKYGLADISNIFPTIQKEFNYENIDEMYASIGYGSVTISQITNYLFQKDRAQKVMQEAPVEIKGEEDISEVIIPKCCCPIYGDPIVGVRSKNGITIHVSNCINLKDKTKLIEAIWKKNVDRMFDVNLKIVSKNAVGYASKLLGLISKQNVNISKIVARETNNCNDCEFDVCVGVKNNTELSDLIAQIKTIEEVKSINRSFD